MHFVQARGWEMRIVTPWATGAQKNCEVRLVMCNLGNLKSLGDCYSTKINNKIPYKCVFL